MLEFSDIFIAKQPAEAIHYDVSAPNYPHIPVPDLTDYEISALWASLTNSKLKPQHDLEFIDIDSDALLYQFPTAFTEALAKLDDKQITTAASIWSEYEDITWHKEQAKEKIKAIHNLAKQAVVEDKALFLIFI